MVSKSYYDDLDALSDRICEVLIETVKKNRRAAICFATGSSPLLGYRKFVKEVIDNNIDVSGITIIKLDEWCGLDMTNTATCEHFLQQEIIKPLAIRKIKYISFNSKAVDFEEECEKIKSKIEALPCIDLTILGIGKNGHIGLNEPGEFVVPEIHVTDLDAKTKTHSMLYNTSNVSKGITIGFKDILSSKKILFIVTGPEKRIAYEQFLSLNVTTQNPSTFLKLHNNVECIVDNNIS